MSAPRQQPESGTSSPETQALLERVMLLERLAESQAQELAALRESEARRVATLAGEARWLTAVLDAIPMPVLFLEPETARVRFANEAARRSAEGALPLESNPEEFARAHPCVDADDQPLPFESQPGVRAARGEALGGEEVRWLSPAGIRTARAFSSPVAASHGHPATVVCLFEDVTDWRRLEAQVEAHTAELERSNEDLQRFAYVVSHDLREPLRQIALQAQVVARSLDGERDAATADAVSQIVRGSRRMDELVRGILAYARVGQPGAEREQVALENVLQWVLLNLSVSLKESGASITSDPLPVVFGHQVQMIQLLQNLIGNAVKYRSAEPPRIHIGVERRDGHWLLAVRDNGQGFDPRNAERIFGLFQRLHPGDASGTGIGLALCRRIAEAHGGRIWAESREGHGSAFFVLLPA